MNYSKWKQDSDRIELRTKIRTPGITEKQYRYRDNKLRASGLLEWERFWLVAHRTDTLGMKIMIKERKELYQKANEEEMPFTKYAGAIAKKYRTKGWTFNNGNLNPFDMMEYYRDRAGDEKDKWPYSKKVPHTNKDFKLAKENMVKRERVMLGKTDPHPARRGTRPF